MNNSQDNMDIVVDLYKIWRIIYHRKWWILLCFSLVILFTVILTTIIPKKYVSEAKMLINKSGSTNLSDINPFVLSDSSERTSMFAASQGPNLNNELLILKSSLVLEPVIKENNLKYNKGPKKGKYIEVSDFPFENLNLGNEKGSNVITISFKSIDPNISYGVVNSLINNYKLIYKDINSNKALRDTLFLEKSYFKAKNSLNDKILKLKQIKSRSITPLDANMSSISGLLSLYDKRIGRDAHAISQSSLNEKKFEDEVAQETLNLNMLKTKYDWSALVGNMSKDVTNIVILENPKVSDLDNFVEPKLLLNILIAIILSSILSSILILTMESTNKKLSYSLLDDKSIIVDNKLNIDTTDIETNIILNKIKQVGIISLLDPQIEAEYINYISEKIKTMQTGINLTAISSSTSQHIHNIIDSDYVILLTNLNYTEKNIYIKLKEICTKLQKENQTIFLHN